MIWEEWAIEVEDLTVMYGDHPALWDVDWRVPQGCGWPWSAPTGPGRRPSCGP
jgi:manganese/zinc/iron transport system ATP- binding protein